VRALKPGVEPVFGFRVEHPDDAWQQCSDWLDTTTVPAKPALQRLPAIA
jgi:hypothetical protein